MTTPEDTRTAFDHMLQAAYPADDVNGTCEPEHLRNHFSPQAITTQAHRIYEYMEEHNVAPDSWTRESMFTYASAHSGIDYEVFYQAWLNQAPVATD